MSVTLAAGKRRRIADAWLYGAQPRLGTYSAACVFTSSNPNATALLDMAPDLMPPMT
jgi:hypothetical protein